MKERPVITVLKEGIVVGLATVAVAYALYKINKNYLNRTFDTYGILFLVGFFIHIGSEYLGINRWYCEDAWPNSHVTCKTKTKSSTKPASPL